MALKYW